MAPKASFKISSLLHHSSKIKLILVIITLVCGICTYAVAETDQVTSQPSMGEVADEIGNPFPSISDKGAFSSSFDTMSLDDPSDLMTYKRHMGAIAALSGSRQFTGSRSFIPPSKKHLGSIAAAAQSKGRTPAGRKLELLFPTKADLYKRHLGAFMALSGAKSKPQMRSLKESSEYQIDSPADTFDLETLPMSFTRGSNIMDAEGNEIAGEIIIPAEIQSSALGSLLEYADELSPPSSSENEFQHMNNDEVLDRNLESGVLDGANVVTYKSKRFLGPHARGGWFPRHFRGIVSENTFGKRHIGALARLGWMPHAKGNSRLGLALDERAEIGLKRNDAVPRRRMLYHFTAPSLWTSPRGK